MRVVLQVILTAEDACGDANDGDQADNDQKENYEQNHQPEVIFFISRIQYLWQMDSGHSLVTRVTENQIST